MIRNICNSKANVEQIKSGLKKGLGKFEVAG